MMKNIISVVIAAYNEAPRIAEVLSVVEHHPLIGEVIVINDGSTDNTSQVANKFDVKLIENKNNLILLLDADLKGLNQNYIKMLVSPVIDGKVDWTLSLRKNSFKIMKLMKMDWMSGERVIPKHLLNDPIIWSRPDIGYSLETLINKSLLTKKTTFRTVYLDNVSNINKSKKIGFIKGWFNNIIMVKQISKVVPIYEFFWQFLKMSYLNRKYSKR